MINPCRALSGPRCSMLRENTRYSPDLRELEIAAILEQHGLKPSKTIAKKFYRQALCFCLMSTGKSSKDCAALLGIKEDTVRKHDLRFRERLNSSNRVEAFRIARQRGYIIEKTG